MKSKLSSLYLKFLAACITLLGFSACDEEPEYGVPDPGEYPIPMYGVVPTLYIDGSSDISDENNSSIELEESSFQTEEDILTTDE